MLDGTVCDTAFYPPRIRRHAARAQPREMPAGQPMHCAADIMMGRRLRFALAPHKVQCLLAGV